METRNVELTLEKAQKWYKKGGDLKEVALQAFTEEELKGVNFKCITTIGDVLRALNIDASEFTHAVKHLEKHSKASAAAFKVNLVRKALNMGQKMDFKEGTIWYPYNYFTTTEGTYFKDEIIKGKLSVVAEFYVGCEKYLLLGGNAGYCSNVGLGHFYNPYSVGYTDASIGFLGCATKEIAQHMSKYFGKEIFEAKYGDVVNFKWV